MLADVSFEDRDGISVARVRGEVDMSNATELSASLQGAVEHVAAGLVLDLSGTSYLDSAGLHFVFDLGKRMRDRGQRLELVVPPDSPVAAILKIVGVESLAPVSETLEQAVQRLRLHADDTPPEAA
jgi:anti-anti-sigma factor